MTRRSELQQATAIAGYQMVLLAVALGSATLSACDECDEGESRCDGSLIEDCVCDTWCEYREPSSCDDSERPADAEPRTCIEKEGMAACLVPEACTAGDGKAYCDDNIMKWCRLGFLDREYPCPEGYQCTKPDGDEATCIDLTPPEPCDPSTVRCLSESTYERCRTDRWAWGGCPSGWACDATKADADEMPCTPPRDGGA